MKTEKFYVGIDDLWDLAHQLIDFSGGIDYWDNR